MRWRIKRCPNCKTYTLKDVCPKCGAKTVVAHPHRFSPEDKYVSYRVRMKYPDLVSKLEAKLREQSTSST